MTAQLTALTASLSQQTFLGPRGIATVHFAHGTTQEQLADYAEQLAAHLGGPTAVEYGALTTEDVAIVTVTQLPMLTDGTTYVNYRTRPYGAKAEATRPYTAAEMADWFAQVVRFAQPIAEHMLDGVQVEQVRNAAGQLEYATFGIYVGWLNGQHAKYLKRLRGQNEVLRAEIVYDNQGKKLLVSLKRPTLNQDLLKETTARVLLNVGIALHYEPVVRDNFRAVLPGYDPQPRRRNLRQLANRHRQPRGRRLVS